MNMKIALITARGGSKRIPKKNIKPFFGQPIIGYPIKAALNAGCFDKIIVSTDSEEIAEIAKSFGAEVPFIRPHEISNDHASTMDVIEHALNFYTKNRIEVEAICCIYPTAPFVRGSDLKSGYDLYVKHNAMYVFSATSFPFPIQRGFYLDAEGRVNMFQPEHLLTRSQDLEEAYHDAGQFYWCRPEAVNNRLPIFAPHSVPVLMDRSRVQDIDTPEDWDFAEKLYTIQNS